MPKIWLYRVIYRYRLMKKHSHERWKPKYKWKVGSVIIRCESDSEVELLLMRHIENKHNGRYEVTVSEMEKLNSNRRFEDKWKG